MAEHKWEPCTTWAQFYWLWLKVAISHAWSIAEIVGFALVLLIPIVPLIFPKMQESSLAPLAWKIPLGVLAIIGFVRLISAPYWIYRDRHQTAQERENVLMADLSTRNETITALSTRPKRSPAEQNDYDTAKKALRLLKEKGVIAMRHIRKYGSLTFGTYSPVLPPGLNLNDTLWVYNHCASEGILTQKDNLGNSERTFAVSPKMEKILDELLYEDDTNSAAQ